MTLRGLTAAAFALGFCLSVLALLVYLFRPVVLVPKEGPPMFPACRVDSTGAPRLVWYQVTLDR